MNKVNNLCKISQVIATVLYCILDTSVKVDGKYALRTGRNTAGSKCITEAVVLYLIAETTA